MKLTFLQIKSLRGLDITKLDYSYVGIDSIEGRLFKNLKNLKELDLSNNQLTSLPESIGELENLQKLNLNYNQLTSLPENIGNLTNLHWLYVGANKLKSLPETIGGLTNLCGLYVGANKLKSLPESFRDLRIYNLELEGNPKIRITANDILNIKDNIGIQGYLIEFVKDKKELYNLKGSINNRKLEQSITERLEEM